MIAARADVVLAHGGGIPEVLSVAVPLLLLGAILYAGRKREKAEREAEAAAPDTPDADPETDPGTEPGSDVSR